MSARRLAAGANTKRKRSKPGHAAIAVPSFVHLSSERTLEPVSHDSSFAEKQESHPALLLVGA
jgi:hypothetical protein